ncbi:MAG: hypothetical protein JJU45_16330 [Acidimicrobiia bacterium]|nr:hypothetical protein [Acidimicrobiia bacterium]
MDAFDADALIDAAVADHRLGRRVRALFTPDPPSAAGSERRLRLVRGRADRFITNNATDFPKAIAEIQITYPSDLPEP